MQSEIARFKIILGYRIPIMDIIKRILKIVVSTVAVAAIIYMLWVLARAGAYTVLSTDDFSHGVDLGIYREFFLKHIFNSLFFTGLIYLIWQGTFFSMFIQALFSPINGFMYPQLRIVMIINVILIFASLLFLIYELFQRAPEKSRFLIPVVDALSIFSLFGIITYYEVLFWYSGSTSYGFPFSVMLFGLAFTLRYYRLGKRSDMILAKVLGFLAGGGTLMVAGAGCYIALLILIFYSVKNHYVDYDGRRIFKWWFIGALVNTVAPGNYFRKIQSPPSGGLLSSVKNSVLICLRNYYHLIKEDFLLQFLLLFVIIGIIIGLISKKKLAKRDLKLLTIIAILSPVSSWFAAFPATLGYGATAGLGNRCNFLLNGCFILSAIFAAIVIGYELAVLFGAKSSFFAPILVTTAIFLSVILPGDINANKFTEIGHQLTSGEIPQYYAECKNFVENLYDYPKGSDVVISIDEIPRAITNTHEFYDFGDPSNPEFWINEALATYYGFKSFSAK